MDSTLQALGGILLKAIPTLILLFIVNIYLRSVFFKPLEEILKKRREMTEGAREAAEASFKRADERSAEYEAKLREARSEMYREHEKMRRSWIDDQAHALDETRKRTHELVQNAKAAIDKDVEASKNELATYADSLADQIAGSLLKRRTN